MDINEAQRLWDASPGYLNTASVGLPPRPAWTALQTVLDEWRHGRGEWVTWDKSTAIARAAFARLIGASPDDITIGSTTSALIGLVAAALPPKARVIAPEIEFTSNLFPWLVQASRGVDIALVPARRLVEALHEAPRTSRQPTVVAFSAVQSSTGEVIDFDAVVDAARAIEATVVVDATQAVGWLPRQWSRADAVVVSAYKWPMAPRGASFAYLAPHLRERLTPLAAGWYAGQDPHDAYYGPPLRLATNARRFDVSPAWFCFVGAAPAMELLLDIGVEQVHAHNVGLANRFRAGLGLPAGDSAIVTTAIPDGETRLARAGVRASVRAGRVRLSFHVYTTEADVDRAVEALT